MSSVVDEDTARAIDAGRETALGLLAGFQRELKKVFLVFVVFFLGTVLALRWWIWEFLETNVTSEMAEDVAADVDIVARTPFDVILMQFKIGLIVGVVMAVVVGLYLVRQTIVRRIEETVEVTAPRVYGFVAVSIALAVGGILYAYSVFFPLMFMILAEQAHAAGVKPSYGIVRFTEFLLLLTISFGLAAQLPLFMGVLSYTELVPYETFRDKWRYAVLGIFVFGAVFSPPDPFTQILWAIPLLTLYAFSLGVAKVVTNVRRAGVQGSPVEPGTFRRKGYQVLGVVVLAFAATVGVLYADVADVVWEPVLGALPGSVSVPFLGDTALPTTVERGEPVDWVVAGVQAGAVFGGIAMVVHLIAVLRMPVIPKAFTAGSHDPADLDLGTLDAAGVRAAPPEAFAALSEDEAVELAGDAMDAGDEEKGRLLLERWDEVAASEAFEAPGDEYADVDYLALEADELRELPDEAFGRLDEETALDLAGQLMDEGHEERGKLLLQRWDAAEAVAVDDGDAAGTPDAEADPEADEGSDPILGTAAGMFDAFSEEERDEDDIGGYIYDVRFILDSLRSRMFLIFAVFMAVFIGSFAYLYTVGIQHIVTTFVAQVPNEAFAPDQRVEDATDVVVALHPVEVLIFIVKFSGVLAIMATLPLVLYYAWPALQQRGIAPGTGDRRGFLVWGAVLLTTTAIGAVAGFFGIAPYVISYLVTDAIETGMVVSYRVRSLLWVVFFMTIGIGLFLNVPVGMVMLHLADLVRFETMWSWWRHVTLGIFAVAALLTPSGVLTMILFAIPASLAYLLGLAVLWVLTAPWRLRGGRGEPQTG